MIIIKFQEGLGNQMFQYAFYQAMKSYYFDSQVKMDLSEYRYGRFDRQFLLDKIFGIKCDQASDHEIRNIADYYPMPLTDSQYKKRIYRLYKSLVKKKIMWIGRKNTHIIQDDPTIFNKNFFDLDPLYSFYCEGYWLNSAYFRSDENELRDIFKFNLFDLDEGNRKFLLQIKNSKSVAVHIRRGDYQSSRYDIVGLDYYNKAIDLIQSRISDPIYYFFSDAPNYCKEHFSHIKNKVIVDCNTSQNCHLDLYLMSQCEHNIIPNSTFSFWSAYLNANPNKIVIAPMIYLKEFKNSLALDNWICLSNN